MEELLMKQNKVLAETMLIDSLNGAGHLDQFWLAIKKGASINLDNTAIEFAKTGKMDSFLSINGGARVSGFLAMASKVNAGNLDLINASLSCNANVELGEPLISMLFHLDREGISRDIDSPMGKAIINTIKAGAIVDKIININGKIYNDFLEFAKSWNVDESLCDEIEKYAQIPARLRKAKFREENKENLEKYINCHEELQLDGKSPEKQKDVILRACRGGFIQVLQDALDKGIEIDPRTAYKEALSTHNDDVVEFLINNNIDYNFDSKRKDFGQGLSFKTENDNIIEDVRDNNTVDDINYSDRLQSDYILKGGSPSIKSEWKHNLVEGAIRMQDKDILILALRNDGEIEWQDEIISKDKDDNYTSGIQISKAENLAKNLESQQGTLDNLESVINEYKNDPSAFKEKYNQIEADNKTKLQALSQTNSQQNSCI